MGVFRILAALWIFTSMVMITFVFGDLYGQTGFIPSWVNSRNMGALVPLGEGLTVPRLNLLAGSSDGRLTLVVHFLTLFAAFFSLIGYRTRIATIILAVGLVSLHHRNALVLHGGDSVMRISAIYLALAPSGAAVSLDRWLAVRKGIAPAIPPDVSLWPQRLVAYNLALIYFTTTWAKWFGTLWKNGTATWYPARLNEFRKFPVPDFVNEMPMVMISTYGTIVVEFALGVLVWYRPLRKWVLLSGLIMHGWIEYSMNVPLFAFAITSMYVAFYDGEEVAAWWDRLKGRFSRKSVVSVEA